jgi:hypothetical protein
MIVLMIIQISVKSTLVQTRIHPTVKNFIFLTKQPSNIHLMVITRSKEMFPSKYKMGSIGCYPHRTSGENRRRRGRQGPGKGRMMWEQRKEMNSRQSEGSGEDNNNDNDDEPQEEMNGTKETDRQMKEKDNVREMRGWGTEAISPEPNFSQIKL